MSKAAIYILLTLIYLGLSKSLSIGQDPQLFIRSKEQFHQNFKRAPLSVILVNGFSTGLLIKTFYHQYKVIYGPKLPRFITVQVSNDFYTRNKNNIGLSVFRREETSLVESTVPMPAGMLYIGNPNYGKWQFLPKEKKTIWRFNRSFEHFNHLLDLNGASMTYEYYQDARSHLFRELPFRKKLASRLKEKNETQQNIGLNEEEFTIKDFLKRYLKTTSTRNFI